MVYTFAQADDTIVATATLTLTADAQVIAAPGAELSIYVRSILVGNTSASLVRVDLKEGSGGTVRVSMPAAASGGGFSHTFEGFWRLPPNTALFGALSGAVTDVRVNIEYFIGK